MKWEDLEERFGDYVNSHEDTGSSVKQANLSRDRIWAEIHKRVSPAYPIRKFWWLAATIIGVVMVFSYFYYSGIAQKDEEIARLESRLNSLTESENILSKQLIELQDKLAMTLSEINTSENILNNAAINSISTESEIKIGESLQILADSILLPYELEQLDPNNFLTEIKEPTLIESIIAEDLFSSKATLTVGSQTENIQKGLVHYKIDYGELNRDNDTIERPWKLTITYQ